MLLVTANGVISQSLIYALEREFSWVDIEQVGDIAAACAPFQNPVGLVLIDAMLIDEEGQAERIVAYHPQAMVAAIEPSTQYAVERAFEMSS